MSIYAVLTMLGALAGVLAIMATAGRLLQLKTFRLTARPGQTLVRRESIALDPRRRIHLIQCGQRQVLVLTGGNTDLVVGWIPEP